MMTFEDYLKSQDKNQHLLVSSIYPSGDATVYVHAINGNGETAYFRVRGNELIPITVSIAPPATEDPDDFPNEQNR